MKLQRIKELAEKLGDFYAYYAKHRGNGTTYLVGTTNFNNKYIQKMASQSGSGLREPITEHIALNLELMQVQAAEEDKLMVFSWTNNKFRFLNAKDVRSLAPMLPVSVSGRNK